jgi:hypothetical protein
MTRTGIQLAGAALARLSPQDLREMLQRYQLGQQSGCLEEVRTGMIEQGTRADITDGLFAMLDSLTNRPDLVEVIVRPAIELPRCGGNDGR